jgi:hypothetical protein
MDSVYEYEYDEEYSKDIKIDKQALQYSLTECPRCKSWRILFYNHKVDVMAQTPDAVWDIEVDWGRNLSKYNYYICYDCGLEFKKCDNTL